MTIGRIIDVSSAQHPGGNPGQGGVPINWTQVAEAGVTAVFIKATQGTTYVNPWLGYDLAGAQDAGLLVSCYHFATMTDPVAEAQFFMRHAAHLAQVLDYETNTNVPWARSFLQALGLPPSECMTYGSLSTLKDFYAQLPSLTWVAAYGQSWPGLGVLWQFTDAAAIPGISAAVDEDSWHGDETQYGTFFGEFAPPPPPPNPIPEGAEEMDSVVAPNGDIVSHYRTPQNHLLEVTRKSGQQGSGTTNGTIQVDDITAQWPQFEVVG